MNASVLIDEDLRQRIIDYYVEAGLDYAFWSPGFNMHFGYGALSSLFIREKMLNRMTEEVMRRLRLNRESTNVADFGCGVGGSMRKAVQLYPEVSVTGVTIVPWQKEKGDAINVAQHIKNLEIRLEDYHCTSIASDSMDGVYAIESACYSPQHLQEAFFRETYRVLKPGGRMVLADGFMKVGEDSLNICVKKIYAGICDNWALPGMMNVNIVDDTLRRIGFKEVQWEDVSWRVAPSVAHVPFVILRFLLYTCLKKRKISSQSINNLKGSFQTLLLGMHRRNFSYFLLSAIK